VRLRPAILLLALLAAACGGGDGGAVEEEPAPAVPPGPLVVLVRYGGLAGLHERVSVDVYGQVTIVSDRSPAPTVRTLPSGELASLRTALERSDIGSLERNYLDPRARDAYQYDVTYQGTTVTADEGVLPPRLRPAVDQLVRLLP
jgi:hypothetical protein